MPLRVIIVDDEPLAREELEFLLSELDDVDVVATASNGIDAVSTIRAEKPDLVFLDVQMPGLDGFAVLKKLLPTQKPMPEIVFATAFDQYAVRAFEVNAIDYLLKPFDTARLQRTIEKVKARTQKQQQENPHTADERLESLMKLLEQQAGVQPQRSGAGKIVVRSQQRLLLVDEKEICFASTDEGLIRIVTQSVEGTSNCRTLEELAELMAPDRFWRVHRSHLVNIQHILEVVPWFKSSYQLRMDDRKHTELPVSRAQTKRLRELFNL